MEVLWWTSGDHGGAQRSLTAEPGYAPTTDCRGCVSVHWQIGLKPREKEKEKRRRRRRGGGGLASPSDSVGDGERIWAASGGDRKLRGVEPKSVRPQRDDRENLRACVDGFEEEGYVLHFCPWKF